MFIGAQIMTNIVVDNTTGANDAVVIDWSQIWFWPCVGAAAILLLFLIAFRESRKDS